MSATTTAARQNRELPAYLARCRARHGDKFDPSELVPRFAAFLGTGQRIRVANTRYDYVRTGTVGATGGWRPAFLLMHRSSDVGSSDILGPDDVITHVQYGRRYVPVADLYRDPNTVTRLAD